MSVRVWGNPSPFAIGCSMVSWEAIEMGGTYVYVSEFVSLFLLECYLYLPLCLVCAYLSALSFRET